MQSIPFIRSKMAIREMASFEFGSVIKGLTIAPYDTVLWTMLQLIIYVVLAPIFFLLLKNKYVGLFALMGAFAVGLTDWNIPLLVHGNAHLFTYMFGAYAGLHWFQPCIMKLWLLTGIKGNVGALIGMFVCSFLTIILCIFCARICKNWMPRVYSILSGRRG